MAHHQRSMSAMAHHQRSVAVMTTPTYDTMKGTAMDVFPPQKTPMDIDWTGNPEPGTGIGWNQKRGDPIRAGAVAQGRMPEVNYTGDPGDVIGYNKKGSPIRITSRSMTASSVNGGDPLCFIGSAFIIGIGILGGFLIAKQFAHYATGKATFV